ncbi:dynamin family protein [Alkalibacillus aidingensis]|uniref:dynamin family protein n=1 Tax=Alkalibacillus aidingensis TaxID=2747607 RepID=UPI001660F7F5|nr:dynamin family protein [Alkalibacillus aidingensis]
MVTTEVKTELNFDQLLLAVKENRQDLQTKKLLQLYNKWKKQEAMIGFTGHFSAGKSSLINTIVGETLLPSSPIPTSANIVEIKHGQEQVVYHFNNKEYAIEHDIDINQIQTLSKNGQEVESLTISKQLPFMENVTLMDTPGIDSADDEEFNRTLAKVYLIDYFVYVVDYNHVQSEVNFAFLSELEKKQVPYIIVVNQIDKHNPNELSMSAYDEALKQSCQNWGLAPEAIFYTSLKELDHPTNQLELLIDYIQSIMNQKEHYIDKGLTAELHQIIQELVDERFDHLNESNAIEDYLILEEKLHRLQEEIAELMERSQSLKGYYQKELTQLVDQAYLMTFETRELARLYLESIQPKFKVGTFLTKKKTEQEKKDRKEQFLKVINEQINSQINWHVRELFQSEMETYNIHDSELIKRFQKFELMIDEHDVKQVVNPSAEVTGDYVLIFSRDLQKSLARLVKEQINPDLDHLASSLNDHIKERIKSLHQQKEQLVSNLDDVKGLKEDQQNKDQLQKELISQTFCESNHHQFIEEALQSYLNKFQKVNIKDVLKKTTKEKNLMSEGDGTKERPIPSENLSIDHLLNQVDHLQHQIKRFPILKNYQEQINHKHEKLKHMTFTVALFGAFSAGKSSFANAWIGDDILPVSPNPTTAAINKICPVFEPYQHKDVVVTFKSPKTMLYQINQLIAPYINEEFKGLQEVNKYLKKNLKSLSTQLSKTDASFLEAFLSGFKECERKLGDDKQITLDSFKPYVTEERLSCFVEEIAVYYDCDLTRAGVTLVDTPGADSIHARHTNVSMHYVKHSDVLVYVNYYNHAFARADREFLKQLGRVKNAFTMDKMFFILNASDLAASDTELSMVKDYLNDQLQQYGITKPNIYPLSSKRLVEQSGVDQEAEYFFNRFNDFIKHDAKLMVANNLQHEIDSMNTFVDQTLNEVEQNKDQQQQLINEYKQDLNNLTDFVSSLDRSIFVQQIEQQIEELTYYVQERTNIQLTDLMKEVINPATIQSNGKKGQDELKTAIKQLVVDVNQRLSKEFHSTNILLDYHFNHVAQSLVEQINHYIHQHTKFDDIYFEEIKLPNAEVPRSIDSTEYVDLKAIAGMFKNKKDFFEQNAIKAVFELSQKQINDHLKSIADQFKQAFTSHFSKQFNHYFEKMVSEYINSINFMIDSKEQIYQDEEQKERLSELNKYLKNL